MAEITFPLRRRMRGDAVANLQDALRRLLDGGFLDRSDPDIAVAAERLRGERARRTFGPGTAQLVAALQSAGALTASGTVDEGTAQFLNEMLRRSTPPGDREAPGPGARRFEVSGTVRHEDGSPAACIVYAFDCDLRSKERLGDCETDKAGGYRIVYSLRHYAHRELRTADIEVQACNPDGRILATSPILFNAPPHAVIELVILRVAQAPIPLFDKLTKIAAAVLGTLSPTDLQENEEYRDLSFLTGESDLARKSWLRFALAHRLHHYGLEPGVWFALLGSSVFELRDGDDVEKNLTEVLRVLPGVEAAAANEALQQSFRANEIVQPADEVVRGWIEAFLRVAARMALGTKEPSFAARALFDAGIENAQTQERFAAALNEARGDAHAALDELARQEVLTPREVADVSTSFQLADLTQGDFSVVKVLRGELEIPEPSALRVLARKSEAEWVKLAVDNHAAGRMKVPVQTGEVVGQKLPDAAAYGHTLARRFREAFPTAAFSGGLKRALGSRQAPSVPNARMLDQFLDRHPDFELLRTRIEKFLDENAQPGFEPAAAAGFRQQLKAAQRVFKLAPTFEATDALFADDLHSAQKVYRVGRSEFVRRYGDKSGFTPMSAQQTWNRAADTHAAAMTIVADLKALESEALPQAMQSNDAALQTFPNWNNLFQTGDICECEHCRSVLGPAAYFADILMFLKDRSTVKPPANVGDPPVMAKDLLFARRPDLGFIELDCDNALVPLPYVDVVCEVLEEVVAPGTTDFELAGFAAMPATNAARLAAVSAAFAAKQVKLGDDFTVLQVDPADPNRWVVHSSEGTYLLRKKTTPNFFAVILRNTKGTAAELRAYPQYVNDAAYATLKQQPYPMTLPFDRDAEEVRAGFQRSNLQRWDLMRTFRSAPTTPSDGEIACEYFGISIGTAPDEKGLILTAKPNVVDQQLFWGDNSAAWLTNVGRVKTFLDKTRLEYNGLLTLLDLPFINPTGSLHIRHDDSSCDLNKKFIEPLDEIFLDRIHRFLRLWRKLDGWKMWELDLVLRQLKTGANSLLDEAFLIQLFEFNVARKRLGNKATVERTAALFGDLNTVSIFVKPYETRADALYQKTFLNKRLIKPLDEAFEVDAMAAALPKKKLAAPHHAAIMAALGVRETDLAIFESLTKASDGLPHINDELILSNLSFLWRHAWLAKQLKLKADDWRVILKICDQDIAAFANARALREVLDKIDQIKATGFKPDELNWLLTADRTAKAATREADAAKFLGGLRKALQAIHAEYDPAQYGFLNAVPPTEEAQLSALLTSVLQQLNRDELQVTSFLKTLRGPVVLTTGVQGLPGAFLAFPTTITGAPNNIPIQYDVAASQFHLTGILNTPQRDLLLGDASLTNVRDLGAYKAAIADLFDQSQTATDIFLSSQIKIGLPGITKPVAQPTIPISYNTTTQVLSFAGVMTDGERNALNLANPGATAAIDELHRRPRFDVKFFEPAFDAPLPALSPVIDFKQQLLPELAAKIDYDTETRRLTFTGIMSDAERAALDLLVPNVLPLDVAYHDAIASLATQPQTIIAGPRIWLTATDLDTSLPASDTLAKRLATASTKALTYLTDTRTENSAIEMSSQQLGVTEAVTRLLLNEYPILPATLLDHFTGPFESSSATVDYTTMMSTFDGWFWVTRVAAMWKRWKLTLQELEQLRSLTAAAQLLDFSTLPLDATGAVPSIDRFLRMSRLVRLRDSLPEPSLAFLELLRKVNDKAYLASVSVSGVPAGFVFPAAITGAPSNIDIQYDQGATTLRLAGLLGTVQRDTLLNNASLAAVSGILTYQQAINQLYQTQMEAFATDVEAVNDAWLAADIVGLIGALDLIYTSDYLLAESWERIRRAFYFIDSLGGTADTVKTLAAARMTPVEASTTRNLLLSKFGEETWLELSTEIQDVLRERKRDALSTYLLTQPMPPDAPSAKWENTNDLYAFYLLDVEMCSCMLTSRLVQASGSVQLFVQRCFMGLEPLVPVVADGDKGDSSWRWWKWMRKYRVWEANRKVFLWPENWIEPELKKDRSSFFKDLENDLVQNEVNQFTVETAFTTYLEKLDGVAQLEIAGFYQEDDADETIVHVFGRTKGSEPHIYYYRRFDYRQWTPWEKVDLEIEGDYLVPAVVNKRLFLFWPVFTEVPSEQGNRKVTTPDQNATENEAPPPKKRIRLQLAASDYRLGKWTPRRISKEFKESQDYMGEIVKKEYRFIPFDHSDGRFLVAFQGHSRAFLFSNNTFTESNVASLQGTFDIFGCHGFPELDGHPGGYFRPAVRPKPDSTNDVTTFQKWVEIPSRSQPGNDFSLQSDLTQLPPVPVLLETPGIFRMTSAWHFSYLDRLFADGFQIFDGFRDEIPYVTGSWLPYFYNDKKRTFFVLPMVAAERPRPIEGPFAGGAAQRSYYPEIKRFVRELEKAFEAIVRAWVDSLNLPATLGLPRQSLALFLASKFPEEPAPSPIPPYMTDAQLIELMVRFVMRYFHFFLGGLSAELLKRQRYHFKTFYHPFVCDFARLVYNPNLGIPAMMSRPTQQKNNSPRLFDITYQPTFAVLDQTLDPQHPSLHPEEDVDFSPDGAYSPYNWELFFHAPLLIANLLSRNQRFEEARNWYHFIFNPIGVESPQPGGSAMSKYWITKPFFETTDVQYVQQRIDNIMLLLAGDTTVPGYSAQAKSELEAQVRDWRTNPFEPHRIANYRTVAYQKTVVMKYLDNVIAWGDYLFRQDSMESINEATQLYILAAEILGPKPRKVAPRVKPPVETFNELEDQFDKFTNALVEVENVVPPMSGGGEFFDDVPPIPMLYFCIPHNENLVRYWDTVADRLYKIRHCMNIEGVVRQLSLFEPPIDPGALVKAVAGGLDISSALADLNAPLPLYRFNVMLQKANEVCADVKALGSALLAALEKKDAEALGLLRQTHEIRLLEAVKALRQIQINEAKEILAGAKKSKELAEIKKSYYESREFMNAGEIVAIALSTASTVIDASIALAYVLAGGLRAVPQFMIGAAGIFGSPQAAAETGGKTFGDISEDVAKTLSAISHALEKGASIANTVAGYQRRKDDWDFQGDLAAKEIEQIDKQIAAAELRISIVEKELENQSLQIENAKAVDEFMHDKYTNLELYQWQIGQISGVYFQSYKLAYDLAKRAERCLRFELGLQDSSYISFGYWDSLKKGLLAGEKLQYDLRRLENAYLEQNHRELELTKHISLALVDPLALVALRETGRCFVRLPEEIFDLDYPGHYFRRVKSVSLTLPCVAGPYTTVPCTLRLLSSSIRINTANGDNGYPHNTDDQGMPIDDDRFIENSISVKAIATSNAQNDSGLFELNFRDDRYLPFEGAGVVSQWAIELFNDPKDNNPDPANPDFGRVLRQIDNRSLSDAVLHVKFTAREDAGPFKNRVVAHLRNYFAEDDQNHAFKMFDLRQELPMEWARFLNPNPGNGNVLELALTTDQFPMRDQLNTLKFNTVWFLARCTDGGSYKIVFNPPLAAGSDTLSLARLNKFGGLHFARTEIAALGVEMKADDPPIIWELAMTRPGDGNLQKDATTGRMEVEDVLLVIGYEWE